MINLKYVTFIKKHIKQNSYYYSRMRMVEYKGQRGGVFSDFNTKKYIPMLKLKYNGLLESKYKIDKTNVHFY